MSPAMLVGKAKMIGETWYPSIEETDVLLSELSKIQPPVSDTIDAVLDYRRELTLEALAKELTWPVTG